MAAGYLLRESFSGFSRAKLATSTAIFTIMIALLLVSTFAIIFMNLNSLIESVRNKVEMEAFLDDDVSPDSAAVLGDAILQVEGVKGVRYISKDEAARIFREEFGEDVHKVLDFNPLPASLKISLAEGYNTARKSQVVYQQVKSLRGVNEVIYRKSLLEMLDDRARLFIMISLLIGCIITLSSVFLVANTIRLAIYAKRRIIVTMRLVGATKMFIRIPFLIEGFVQGLVGAVMAAGMMYILFEYAARITALQFLESITVLPSYYGIVLILGCLLGFLGSMISIRRFLRDELQ